METVSWLSNVKDTNGTLKYTLDPRVIQYIDDLRGLKHGYLSYEFNEILYLEHRKKIIPIFELMYSHLWDKGKEFKISSDELLWSLFLDNSEYYNNIKRFNDKILKPCIKSINNSTFLTIDYRTIGNPIHTFIFTIQIKGIKRL